MTELSSFRALADALDEPSVLLDEHGAIALANPAFLRAFAADGAVEADLLGRAAEEPPLDESVRTLLGRVRVGFRLRLPGVALWRAGEETHARFDMSADPIPGGAAAGAGSPATLVRFRPHDDAARAALEARRADRMAILGALAAGLAHDINNQLAASMNIAVLLQEELAGDEESRDALEILVGASRQAAALSHRFLKFTGRGEPHLEEIDVGRLVEELFLLLRHELPDGAGEPRCAPDLPTITADAVHVEHALALLLLRGGRAVSVGGGDAGVDVTIELASVDGLESDDSFRLARALLADHGGTLEVRPAESAVVARWSVDGVDALDTAPAAAGRVLVVDDDPMVRDVAVAMIRRLGYEAEAVVGAREAIARVEREPGVDLVLLDLPLDDVDGSATLAALRDRRREARVLISSGLHPPNGDRPASAAVDGVLEKPYTLAMLRNALESALG